MISLSMTLSDLQTRRAGLSASAELLVWHSGSGSCFWAPTPLQNFKGSPSAGTLNTRLVKTCMYLFNDSVNGDKCKNTVVYLQLITAKWNIENSKKTSCRRAAATICLRPLSFLCVRRSTAERLTPPSTPQRSSSFPRRITFPRWPLQLPYS